MFACDVWSLGVTFFEAVNLELPFTAPKGWVQYKNMTMDESCSINELKEYAHPLFKELIPLMLSRDPSL